MKAIKIKYIPFENVEERYCVCTDTPWREETFEILKQEFDELKNLNPKFHTWYYDYPVCFTGMKDAEIYANVLHKKRLQVMAEDKEREIKRKQAAKKLGKPKTIKLVPDTLLNRIKVFFRIN